MKFPEAFLQFIWQHQLFEHIGLQTTNGEPLEIRQAGLLNRHEGPDFLHARVSVAGQELNGAVEVHVQPGAWLAHGHQQDPAYNQVVLHVVWEGHGHEALKENGDGMPTLALKGKVPERLQNRHKELLEAKETLPCASTLRTLPPLVRLSWLDRAMAKRLETKAANVLALHEANNHQWEETAYQVLAMSLGMKTNSQPMLELARAIPLQLLNRQADQLLQIEALLFGKAGLLNGYEEDPYAKRLQAEYRYLAHKFSVAPAPMDRRLWRFMRVRPASQPTIRIAQLAAMLQKHPKPMGLFRDVENYNGYRNALRVPLGEYWRKHYNFGKVGQRAFGPVGNTALHSVLINAVVPLLAAYGMATTQMEYKEKAASLLQELPAEDNRITRLWEAHHIKADNAYDTQALIHQYNHSCQQKSCLECAVGAHLLMKG